MSVERHVLDIPDETGHLTLDWDPSDPQSVAEAKAAFDKLKACGFAFYASDGTTEVKRLTDKTVERNAGLEVRIIKDFEPAAKQTVAMRPMKGG
jgi:hypothetical protein